MLTNCLVGLGIEIAGNTLRHSPPRISKYGEALYPSKRTSGVFLAGVGQSVQYSGLVIPVASYISTSFASASTASTEVRFTSYIGLTTLGLACAAVLLQPVITNIFLAYADNYCEVYEKTREQFIRFPNDNTYIQYEVKDILEPVEIFSTRAVKALCIGYLLFNQPIAVTVGAGTVMSISLLTG